MAQGRVSSVGKKIYNIATSSTFQWPRKEHVLALAITCTGGYVVYKDYTRYPRMLKTYLKGNVIEPMNKKHIDLTYYSRPNDERNLGSLLRSTFESAYFLVQGQVGSGKTRLILHLVKDAIQTDGKSEKGAPIYVHVSQGLSFAESLAEAVNFKFDEHVNFRFFLLSVMQIMSFPGKEEHHKLTRTLTAIETSAFLYANKYNRPAVIVIDGVDWLANHNEAALVKLQQKAKLWADANIVKLIFVTNNEKTSEILNKNLGEWSRVSGPVYIGDLKRDEAIEFLTEPIGIYKSENTVGDMSRDHAAAVYDSVGGRIKTLANFKHNWADGIPLEESISRAKVKERVKFLDVIKSPKTLIAIKSLREAPEKTMPLTKLISSSSKDEISELALMDVLRFERNDSGIFVKFESKLTESVVDEFSLTV